MDIGVVVSLFLMQEIDSEDGIESTLSSDSYVYLTSGYGHLKQAQ
ncbi:hypothetical protein [Candidatus Clavichlamydia salmonicola]|nr:hypothetical protein [Candidatus Clavichlamydia salmonicola]